MVLGINGTNEDRTFTVRRTIATPSTSASTQCQYQCQSVPVPVPVTVPVTVPAAVVPALACGVLPGAPLCGRRSVRRGTVHRQEQRDARDHDRRPAAGLQPYVMMPATVCDGGLQPCVLGVGNPTHHAPLATHCPLPTIHHAPGAGPPVPRERRAGRGRGGRGRGGRRCGRWQPAALGRAQEAGP